MVKKGNYLLYVIKEVGKPVLNWQQFRNKRKCFFTKQLQCGTRCPQGPVEAKQHTGSKEDRRNEHIQEKLPSTCQSQKLLHNSLLEAKKIEQGKITPNIHLFCEALSPSHSHRPLLEAVYLVTIIFDLI